MITTAHAEGIPLYTDAAATLGLDPEIRKIASFYAEHGYVVIDPQIPQELIESANASLRDLFVPTRDPYWADETRVQDGWFFNDPVRQIALAPRVIEILRLLYGREPVPFQTLNFRVGSQQRTHSDIIHFDCLPYGFMCGVWVALEDVDRRNGPLHYYPSSQKLPRFDLQDIGVPSESPDRYRQYEDFVEKLMRSEELERAELEIERGQALIWSANLFHGGSPIADTNRTRLSQVTHYYFEGCLYYTPLFSDCRMGNLAARRVLDVRTGEVASQFYNGAAIENPGEWPPRVSPPRLEPTWREKLARFWRR